MKVIKIYYAISPERRAKIILKKIEEVIGDTCSEKEKEILQTYITRQFYLDRGRGMSIKFLDDEHERAMSSWGIVVKKYVKDLMSFKSFTCFLCGEKIRDGGKINSHKEDCPLYGYRIDFINDIF